MTSDLYSLIARIVTKEMVRCADDYKGCPYQRMKSEESSEHAEIEIQSAELVNMNYAFASINTYISKSL